jgi:hypothetical protein
VGASEWAPHDGGPCPVRPEQRVTVRYRNGIESPVVEARERRWQCWGEQIGESDWDIIAWRAA